MFEQLSPERYARVERLSLTASQVFLVLWDSSVLFLCLQKRISLAYGGIFMCFLLFVGFFPYWLVHNRYVKGVLKDRSRQNCPMRDGSS